MINYYFPNKKMKFVFLFKLLIIIFVISVNSMSKSQFSLFNSLDSPDNSNNIQKNIVILLILYNFS
jgi:hypothetical protein